MKDLIELVESPSFNYARNKLLKSDSFSMDLNLSGDFITHARARSRKLHQQIKDVSMLDSGDL